ncbi:MAG: hypothetical protein ABFS09_10050, partial [Thermodesulfobacteriota bacterium]
SSKDITSFFGLWINGLNPNLLSIFAFSSFGAKDGNLEFGFVCEFYYDPIFQFTGTTTSYRKKGN